LSKIGGTIVRIGVGGAGAILALGLLGAPAGAVGNHHKNAADTACFDESGRTQGRSHSDPDGMSNGGPDKPGCAGGFDSDKDGNNGCGNDADREDDNNGRCGPRPAPIPAPVTTTTSTSTTTTTTTTTPDTTVAPDATVEPTDCEIDPKEADDCDVAAGVAAGRTAPVGTLAATAATTTPGADATDGTATVAEPQTEVLGQTIERPSALARTGAGVGGLALLGGLLCGGGRLAILARRFLRID
jgi:hypothetical protein